MAATTFLGYRLFYRMKESADIVIALLAHGEEVRFKAGGLSMFPTILDGEMVGVRPLRSPPLPPGSIVLYQAHERLVLHRLITLRQKTAETIADAAWHGKETIPREAIIGEAIWVMKGGRQKRLDRGVDRWRGMMRYRLRPLRQFVMTLFNRHAATP